MVVHAHFRPVDGLLHRVVVHGDGVEQATGHGHSVFAVGVGVHAIYVPSCGGEGRRDEKEGVWVNSCQMKGLASLKECPSIILQSVYIVVVEAGQTDTETETDKQSAN